MLHLGRMMTNLEERMQNEIFIMVDIEAAYKGLEIKNDDYLEALDSQDEADKAVIEAIDKDVTVMYAELCTARTIMAKVRAQSKFERTEVKPSTG